MAVLAKIEEQLAKPANLKGMFQLDVVQQRAIANYEGHTGKKDGQARFEQNVFSYMELMAEKPELANLERFQHFKSIVKIMTMGLPMDKLYVMPGKNKTIKVQSTPAGKREMMERMPDIKRFPEAQVVLEGDVFEYDKLNSVILRHTTTDKSPAPDKITLDKILYAYQRIYWADGRVEDVVVNKSKLLKARSKSNAQSDNAAWGQFPEDMCKKVATNRAYTMYHKYPDNVIAFEDDDKKDDTVDVEHTVQPETPVAQTEVVPDTKITSLDQETDDFLNGR